MSVDTTAKIRVAAPATTVAAYVREPDNDPRWIGGIQSARLLTPRPVDVGSQVARVASFLGRRIEYVNEITELTADHLTMKSVKSPFPMRVTYGYRQVSDAETDVWVRVEGDAGGLYDLAAPLMNAAVKRSISGDVRRLKRLLERG
jgi:uncharacterized membrane protein